MNDERSNGAAKNGELPIVIIGSGFSGLGMGILLKQAGIHSFTILEKGGDVGGTADPHPGRGRARPQHRR
jgi:cation diffusion facilitator CzcD-associated flavoprotein CzcO